MSEDIKLKVKGQQDIAKLARNAAGIKMKSELEKIIKKVAFTAEGSIKQGITDVKAVDTGFMRASTRVTSFKAGMEPEARVGPTAGYAIYIHEGTRRMKGRPFIPLGIKKDEKKFSKILAEAGNKIVMKIVVGL